MRNAGSNQPPLSWIDASYGGPTVSLDEGGRPGLHLNPPKVLTT